MAEQNGRQPAQQQQNGGGPSEGYVREVLQPDIDGEIPNAITNLLAADYPLANLERADREYFRILNRNIELYLKEEHPPQDSLVQGELGAALLEEPDYNVHALTPRRCTEMKTALMDAYSRSSRGVEGWQQEEFSKSTSVRRVEDNRAEESEPTGLGRIFS
jgi:hypothetical protein